MHVYKIAKDKKIRKTRKQNQLQPTNAPLKSTDQTVHESCNFKGEQPLCQYFFQ